MKRREIEEISDEEIDQIINKEIEQYFYNREKYMMHNTVLKIGLVILMADGKLKMSDYKKVMKYAAGRFNKLMEKEIEEDLPIC